MEILGANGEVETLEGTPIHPIWSLDREDWVTLGELVAGERLQGKDGTATVLSIDIHNVSLPVYNIEIHGEHVYEVGELGVLVHNNCLIDAAQLQSKFKHAADFGVFGTANRANLQAFAAAIREHVTSLGTTLVTGTYRGTAARIFVDPLSRLAVITDEAGNFISGWRLSPQQLWYTLNKGTLGGG